MPIGLKPQAAPTIHPSHFDALAWTRMLCLNLSRKPRSAWESEKGDFSKDILRVEISGPDKYPLTLVDLPGFYHSKTAEQSLEGKEMVNQLAASYMQQEKSIILTVVGANYNLAGHTVVDRAKEYDPNSERTLGVITKPDLAGRGANGHQYIDLAKGLEAENKLTLGWYVLRNRSDEEMHLGFRDRDLNEERFFQSGDWRGIRPTNRGAESLRKKLSKVLLDHVKMSLPGVIRDIESSLDRRKDALKRLGSPRSEEEELKRYLLDIAETFRRLVREGVDGRYSDSFFGDLHEDTRKFRAQLRKLNRAFDATFVNQRQDPRGRVCERRRATECREQHRRI